jgi:hypothetical protein
MFSGAAARWAFAPRSGSDADGSRRRASVFLYGLVEIEDQRFSPHCSRAPISGWRTARGRPALATSRASGFKAISVIEDRGRRTLAIAR